MRDLLRSGRIFDDTYRPMTNWFNSDHPLRVGEDGSNWMPPVDIRVADNEYVIELEVPGFRSDDVDVEVHEGVLTIHGERTSVNEVKEEGFLRQERRQGQFMRRFSLPEGATGENIKANVQDGLLTLIVPQAEPIVAKKIEVS